MATRVGTARGNFEGLQYSRATRTRLPIFGRARRRAATDPTRTRLPIFGPGEAPRDPRLDPNAFADFRPGEAPPVAARRHLAPQELACPIAR
jgi:hypothetical protein